MAKFSLTNKAVEDLSNIWNYTLNEWSEEQADKYYLELIEGCEYLAENPNFGKNYDKIDLNIFGYFSDWNTDFYTYNRNNWDNRMYVNELYRGCKVSN